MKQYKDMTPEEKAVADRKHEKQMFLLKKDSERYMRAYDEQPKEIRDYEKQFEN